MKGTTQTDLLGGEVEKCAFCKIVKGELEALVVFEDELSVAFLDHNPVFPGHTLLIPKSHYRLIAELPAPFVGYLFANLQLVSEGVKAGMKSDGTFLAINNGVSQQVPHLHIHVIPRRHKDGLRGFFWPRAKYPDERTAREVQEAIRSAIGSLRPR